MIVFLISALYKIIFVNIEIVFERPPQGGLCSLDHILHCDIHNRIITCIIMHNQTVMFLHKHAARLFLKKVSLKFICISNGQLFR